MDKCSRKQKRFAARLKSSKGIICTDIHGRNIVLCNAGQATGLEKKHILELCLKLDLAIEIPKFISEKGESYSFLVFKNTEDAVLFYNTCQGKARICDDGPPLYINFVENVPSNEMKILHQNPNGLTILEGFISEQEEREFIDLFDWSTEYSNLINPTENSNLKNPTENSNLKNPTVKSNLKNPTENSNLINPTENSNLKNREVKHYGYEFRYGSNDVDLNNPLMEKIPKQCDVLWKRLREKGFDLGEPDQLTVNKYKPGQGIPSHVDKHSPFGSTILSLSLGSAVVMDWKHHSGKYVPVVVPARSMMVMQGEARYDWQHGIQPRTWDPIIEHSSLKGQTVRVVTSDTVPREIRISLTFRWTRSGSCECGYKTLCDSAKMDSEEIEDDVASNLEELHVHQVYEQIAGHFSSTRHKPWPRVAEFLRSAAPGSVVLDLGAGNGKNVLPRTDILQIAGERSSGLLDECSRHVARSCAGADCVRLDLLRAPLRDACADIVVCIAVIHHFSSKVRRQQSISTIARLLRPGGTTLITVWAKDQTKSNYLKYKTPETQDMMSVAGITLPVHENRTQFQHNDLLVPWKLRTKTENKLSNEPQNTLLRYYHVFEENELENLCKEVSGIEVENSFYEEGNWCVICKKIK